jgi:hypothetical protein
MEDFPSPEAARAEADALPLDHGKVVLTILVGPLPPEKKAKLPPGAIVTASFDRELKVVGKLLPGNFLAAFAMGIKELLGIYRKLAGQAGFSDADAMTLMIRFMGDFEADTSKGEMSEISESSSFTLVDKLGGPAPQAGGPQPGPGAGTDPSATGDDAADPR